MSEATGYRIAVPAGLGSGIFVTVKDSATGEEQTVEVPADDYFLLCVGACRREHVNAYANGTHVITVKGRRGL